MWALCVCVCVLHLWIHYLHLVTSFNTCVLVPTCRHMLMTCITAARVATEHVRTACAALHTAHKQTRAERMSTRRWEARVRLFKLLARRSSTHTHLLHLCVDLRSTTKCKSRETLTVSRGRERKRETEREREREQVTETDRMTGAASRKCYIPAHTQTHTLAKRCDWQLPQGLWWIIQRSLTDRQTGEHTERHNISQRRRRTDSETCAETHTGKSEGCGSSKLPLQAYFYS